MFSTLHGPACALDAMSAFSPKAAVGCGPRPGRLVTQFGHYRLAINGHLAIIELPPAGGSVANDIRLWLEQLGLDRYAGLFAEHGISFEALPHLTHDDFKEIGLPLGARRILQAAIANLAGEAATTVEAGQVDKPAHQRGEAERRQLTVVFIDLVGSTELSRRIDPEEMREVIRVYQNTVAGEVGRFDGHVAKFMGDGVLAYFGWPRGHEDEAERAVRAGLAIISAVAQLKAPAVETLAARIGIATGLVIVGDLIGEGAAQEESVVGETPNLAARLQALAEPGSVIIAPGTRSLVGDLFDLTDLGTHRLKGYAEPVRAWRVVQEGVAESRFAALHGGALTPLIGREHEIGLIFERFERAKDGEGQVVLLSGEPGIGKSRTVDTVRQRLTGEHCLALSHFCSPFHTNSSLYSIIGLLERAAGFEREEPAADRLAKLEALLARATEDAGEAAPLMAELLSIPTGGRYPPLDLTPEARKKRTLKMLLDFLGGLAAKQPVLLVYEDVHWVDPSTLELLGQLIERIERLPILAIMTFRPEFIPPWPSHGNITSLALGRLARRQGATMIEAVAGGKTLPQEVLDQIIAKTDGVPLFVEELTKTLLESGLLREAEDRFALAGSLANLAIPATLHDSLLARLDRLGVAKETAQLGAALGREFSYDLLAAVSPLGDAELQEALVQIINTGLLFRHGNPPDTTYTFKHALVRDAAYASLLKSRRQQMHARIAQILKDRFPERVAVAPELLAHHYGEAGLTELAIDYWERAGTRALQRSANIEALAHYRAGIAMLDGLPESLQHEKELSIHIGFGSALTSVKGYANPETGSAYRRARELCLKVGNKQRLFPVLYGLWNFENVAGRNLKAKHIAGEMVELAEQHGESGPRMAAYSALGSTLAFMGSWSDANECFEKCIKLYDPEEHASVRFEYSEDPCVQAHAMNSICLWNLGYPEQAADSLKMVGRLSEQLQHANSTGWGSIVPQVQYLLANPQAALGTAETSIAHAKKSGLPFWGALATVFRGWALSRLGDIEHGIVEIRLGIESWRATGSEVNLTALYSALADACRVAGRYDAARIAARDGIAISKNNSEGLQEAELFRLEGLILSNQGTQNTVAAEKCLAHALDVARYQKSRSMELRISSDLARLWHEQGKTMEARDLLSPIYGWFTEGFDTQDLKGARTLLDSFK